MNFFKRTYLCLFKGWAYVDRAGLAVVRLGMFPHQLDVVDCGNNMWMVAPPKKEKGK